MKYVLSLFLMICPFFLQATPLCQQFFSSQELLPLNTRIEKLSQDQLQFWLRQNYQSIMSQMNEGLSSHEPALVAFHNLTHKSVGFKDGQAQIVRAGEKGYRIQIPLTWENPSDARSHFLVHLEISLTQNPQGLLNREATHVYVFGFVPKNLNSNKRRDQSLAQLQSYMDASLRGRNKPNQAWSQYIRNVRNAILIPIAVADRNLKEIALDFKKSDTADLFEIIRPELFLIRTASTSGNSSLARGLLQQDLNSVSFDGVSLNQGGVSSSPVRVDQSKYLIVSDRLTGATPTLHAIERKSLRKIPLKWSSKWQAYVLDRGI